MAFAKGLVEIDKAVEAAASQYGPRLQNLFWKKDGEKYILRFLTDDVIVGQFAEYIETTRKNKDDQLICQDFLIDPDGTNWVEHFGGRQREWGTGNLITPKLTKKGIGVAVIREEKSVGGGKVKIVDAQEVIDVDGKKYTARKFVVIKMSIGNFWDQLRGIGRRAGTICDIDFEITRRGTDKNTKYDISPIRPEESEVDLRDPAVLHEWYGYGTKWDDQNSERFLFCPQTLDEWAEYKSGQKFAEYWIGGLSQNGNSPSTSQVRTIEQDGSPSPARISGISDDDETQAVPSSNSRFSDVRSKLEATFGNR